MLVNRKTTEVYKHPERLQIRTCARLCADTSTLESGLGIIYRIATYGQSFLKQSIQRSSLSENMLGEKLMDATSRCSG